MLEKLRRSAIDRYDLVLIDARSGFSDISIMATLHMPEVVAMMFATNSQSVEGEVARRLQRHPSRRLRERVPLRFLFVPSRVFTTSARFGEWMERSSALLLEVMVDEAMSDLETCPPGLHWEDKVTHVAETNLAMMLRHPWLAAHYH